jgi:hypothetical protein
MSGRARTLLAGASLAALAVCEWRAARVRTVAEDLAELARTSRTDPDHARAGGIGFSFDPAYEEFLAAVRRETPQGAVVALVPPTRHELYVYQAWYVLAPRRVVPRNRLREADYLASYRDGSAPGIPIAGGRLERLR